MRFYIPKYLNLLENYSVFFEYIKEKSKHPGIQKHTKNMGWMFFAKLSGMVVAFITTAYIARHLGPTNYGQLSYALSFTGLFGFIASLGIDQILYRDLIRYPEKRDAYMGTALALRVTSGMFTVILCTVSAFIWSSNDVSLILIFLVSLTFVFSSFQLLGYEFQAEAKSKYPSILSIIVVFVLNIFKIVVILSDQGVIYLAGILVLEPILYGLGYWYLRTREYGSVKNWKVDKTIALSILKDSTPLIFATAFFAVYARIDQVMIKNMINAEAVGLYDSAVRISEIWYFIPNIIVAALFPAVINAKKVSTELYYKRAKKLFILIIAISVFTALPTALLSKYLITIIFGAGFIGALPVLQIYVWSNIGNALNLLMVSFLVAENKTKAISLATFCGMTTNVLLNIILIPRYGMSGAAVASLISYLIPFLSLFLFKGTRETILSIFKRY